MGGKQFSEQIMRQQKSSSVMPLQLNFIAL
jgi:hypothetical protein